jgi:hypothetical protein
VNIRYLTCTCRPSSSSSTTCLSNQQERKFYSRSPLLNMNKTENDIKNQCICYNKYHSTMTIPTKIDDQKEEYYYKKHLKKKRTSLLKFV